MIPLLLFVIGGMPSGLNPVQFDRVDMIEVNHCYRFESDGTVVKAFSQVVFWEHRPWIGERPMFYTDVAGWRMVKRLKNLRIERVAGQYRATWLEGGLRRVLVARTLVETVTHTDEDPERMNRERLPEEFRKGL